MKRIHDRAKTAYKEYSQVNKQYGVQRTIFLCNYDPVFISLEEESLIKYWEISYGQNSDIHQKTDQKKQCTHPSLYYDSAKSEHTHVYEKNHKTGSDVYDLNCKNIAFFSLGIPSKQISQVGYRDKSEDKGYVNLKMFVPFVDVDERKHKRGDKCHKIEN